MSNTKLIQECSKTYAEVLGLGSGTFDSTLIIIIQYPRLLVRGDNRLDLPDTSGRTVLHLAAMIQVRDMVKLIQIMINI